MADKLFVLHSGEQGGNVDKGYIRGVFDTYEKAEVARELVNGPDGRYRFEHAGRTVDLCQISEVRLNEVVEIEVV